MKQERLNFDPVKEVNYLRKFLGESRKHQLEREVSTSLAELLLSEYSHDYLWDGEKIIDKETGIKAGDLSENCEFESQRLKNIEGELKKGKELVVCVSPKNAELDYPDDMVDFWKKGEGEKLTLMRFKTKMSEWELKDFELMNKDGYKLADLIGMLSLAKENRGTSMNLIEQVARNLTTEFEMEFGEKVYLDGEMMTRLYIAIRLEVERKSREIGIESRNYVMLPLEIKNYLYGELKVKRTSGGGCGGSSLSGQFGSEGIIIINTSDGISFRKGSTEGLNYCSKCGCWYSGDKCPICK
ncbi:MAG: hypothetical protein US68_C0001G0033 [Candidatus Shapirobacteria bacterium GW2011_GWE1_38_10]|uniref:Uncharacterized protein n=1 Tax=Candidatus Shapirobacteria bacterium GW2011_GWE1_38_10 TaxID=1618488 RepID=A0A0G0KNS3_9BACT|nr:MAG: hypothetical protein US46_C0004G0049 [Candidatus Shapirobacteria bacterium GW2011_GWF2_37_20]KKQ50834.1 MAG: hypothetical protein US68_C0001G0033 [Candidatus Shapirobacteria bacterium GW2011_GWE1_38_10]KKQ64867.1 MAG: hypothetical protein US85_C0002G0016 [Candidatus Shapirobacteria bacterium GW2011_GWF1_38_23]HBP51047.1 hypothetical protein [Candidatus Shapirobacteria bacterium]